MEGFSSLILAGFGFLWLLIFGAFSWISWDEGERRATRMALTVGLTGAAIFFLTTTLPGPIQGGVLGLVLLLGLTGIILFFLPIGKVEIGNDIPSRRFDERQIMFARARLQPGSPEYENYYAQHPEHQASDARFRSLPGLLSPQA